MKKKISKFTRFLVFLIIFLLMATFIIKFIEDNIEMKKALAEGRQGSESSL